MSDVSTSIARPAAVRATRRISPRPRLIAGRIVLGAATILLSLNLWTGFPLLALWTGSHLAGGNVLSMGGIVAVLIVLAVLMVAGVFVLTWMSARYNDLTGRPPKPRQHPPWMRSMRGGKIEPQFRRRETNAVEVIVVLTVVAVFVAFEVWFFFLASSPVTGV